jgi:hypothetical protein
MRCSVRHALLLAAIAALSPLAPASPARAGAWTQPKGSVYARLEAAGLVTDRVFNAAGEEIDYISALSPGEYRERQVRGYLEYGIAPRFTLVAATAFQDLEVREIGVVWKTWGLSDIRIGGRWGLPTTDVVTALAGEVKIPSGYDPDDFPSLGSGDPDLTISALVGRSFGTAYATADIGYTIRTGPLSDEVPWNAELGWHPTWRLGLRATLRGRASMADELSGGSLDPVKNDSESLKLAGAVSVAISRQWDVEAGLTNVLSGKQTLAGTEGALALVWHR